MDAQKKEMMEGKGGSSCRVGVEPVDPCAVVRSQASEGVLKVLAVRVPAHHQIRLEHAAAAAAAGSRSGGHLGQQPLGQRALSPGPGRRPVRPCVEVREERTLPDPPV